MSPTPALWWKLDETSGTVAADSAGSDPGGYSGFVGGTSFVGSTGAHSITTGVSFNPASISGLAVGDLVIAVVLCQAVNTITTPTGWTKVFEVTNAAPISVAGFTRTIGASEPTVTFTNSAGSKDTAASFVAYRGFTINNQGRQGWDTGTNTATAPGGFATATPQDTSVCVFAGDTLNNGTYATPAGFTSRASQSASSGTTGLGIAVCDKVLASGILPTVTASWAVGGGSREYGWQIDLAPTATGTLPVLGQSGPRACQDPASKAPQFSRVIADAECVHSTSVGPLSGAAWSGLIWYALDSAVDYALLFQQRDWTQVGPIFDVEGMLKLEVLSGTSIEVVLSNGTISPDTHSFSLSTHQQKLGCWHLAAVRRDGGTGLVEVFVDNVNVGSFTQSHSLVAGSVDVGADAFDAWRNFDPGGDQHEWERFVGRLGNLKLYTSKLSDADIAAEWATGCPCSFGFISIGMLRL